MLQFARWKTVLIWLTVLASILIAMPNMFSDRQLEAFPDWISSRKMPLSLDLQGGSYIMLKIDRSDVVKGQLQATVDAIGTTLRGANIGYTGLSGADRTIQVTIRDPAQLAKAKDILKPLTAPVEKSGLTGGTVTSLVMEDAGNAMLRFSLTEDGIARRLSDDLTQSMAVLQRRVGELRTARPVIRRQGSDRIVVQMPGEGDPQRLKDLVSQTARLSFRVADPSMPVQDAINGAPPVTSEVLYSIDDPPTAYLLEKRALLTGDDLVDAQAGVDAQTSEPVVSFRFKDEAVQRLTDAAQRNPDASFAIVFDNQVIAAPSKQPAVDGMGRIAGNLSPESAEDLALVMRAGAFPSALTVVEERTVGPELGADSITAGFVAGVIGAGLVAICMCAFYGLFGLIANIAVLLNVVMIIAVLSLLGFTLTLPGIAGIVLTIGMAVDSNVLIYERIRDEMRAGAPLHDAIRNGFSRAFSTVVDANVTTFIATVILFYLGSGPLRGFAVTLCVGLLTTAFTAFTLTRWMVVQWFRARLPTALPKGIRTGIFDGATIRFMSFRRYTFVLTAILSVGSLALFVTQGLNFGIDFRGGSVVELKATAGNADIVNIRDRLGELNLGDVEVDPARNLQSVVVHIGPQDGGENAEQSAIAKVRDEFDGEYDFQRVEVVGPSVSGDLTQSATIGVLAALAAILLYVWLRFRWQFAVGAIIATLHDVLLTLGLFALTGLEFNLGSIAAILTIVGYSLNDTMVIYDRIRENLRKYRRMPVDVLIDSSINSTLSRTILTSLTTTLALIALSVFGGEIIRSFTFTMLFGVIVGTLSSIYIAGPVLILFRLRSDTFSRGLPGDGAEDAVRAGV